MSEHAGQLQLRVSERILPGQLWCQLRRWVCVSGALTETRSTWKSSWCAHGLLGSSVQPRRDQSLQWGTRNPHRKPWCLTCLEKHWLLDKEMKVLVEQPEQPRVGREGSCVSVEETSCWPKPTMCYAKEKPVFNTGSLKQNRSGNGLGQTLKQKYPSRGCVWALGLGVLLRSKLQRHN